MKRADNGRRRYLFDYGFERSIFLLPTFEVWFSDMGRPSFHVSFKFITFVANAAMYFRYQMIED